jgi:hypothetical protein
MLMLVLMLICALACADAAVTVHWRYRLPTF